MTRDNQRLNCRFYHRLDSKDIIKKFDNKHYITIYISDEIGVNDIPQTAGIVFEGVFICSETENKHIEFSVDTAGRLLQNGVNIILSNKTPKGAGVDMFLDAGCLIISLEDSYYNQPDADFYVKIYPDNSCIMILER
ncbi:MAG: hypothetical protein SNJ70_03415 [Armatimonadota bacterium]